MNYFKKAIIVPVYKQKFNYLMKFYLENKNSNKDENKKAFEISLKKHKYVKTFLIKKR